MGYRSGDPGPLGTEFGPVAEADDCYAFRPAREDGDRRLELTGGVTAARRAAERLAQLLAFEKPDRNQVGIEFGQGNIAGVSLHGAQSR